MLDAPEAGEVSSQGVRWRRRAAIAGLILALGGPVCVAAPAYVRIDSFLLNDFVLFLAPVAGAVGFVVLTTGAFARGWLSGMALFFAAGATYLSILLGAAFVAARTAGIA